MSAIGLHPFPQPIDARSALPRAGVALVGLGTAVPNMSMLQSEVASIMAELWKLSPASLDRWQRIIAGSGIERRHGVIRPEAIVHQSTAARMNLYQMHAPELAANAAQVALGSAQIEPEHITDLIVITCTGFAAPGVDVELVQRLGLSPKVRRSIVGFMGCFGAITGLRAAIGACSADPNAVALVVCVELCSLHMRADADVQNQLASALFADGAAAAVVCGRKAQARTGATPIAQIHVGASTLVPEGRDWMTWTITDAGFAMTLSKQVPIALRKTLRPFIRDAYQQPPRTFLIHPGGPGILDAAEAALDLLPGNGTHASRDILRDFGNMSSATILFVLAGALRRGPLECPAALLAFGPGLTIESLLLTDPGDPAS